MLDAGGGCVHQKMAEWSPLHPAQSATGLVGLGRTFIHHRLVFVRVVRHPLEVCESFYGAKLIARRSGKCKGIASNGDDAIAAFIENTSRNSHEQRAAMGREPLSKYGHGFIELRYERIGEPGYVRDVCGELPGADKIAAYAESAWGVAPVRTGRLSEGIGSALPDGRRAWFAERLAESIERDGFA